MKRQQKLISIISLVIIIGVIGYYLYLLHSGEAQTLINEIRNYGVIGILIGIIVQSLVNILPVPGEFISIILMEIYGPIWGGIYSWIGGVAGAVGALYLTRWVAKPFFSKMAQPFLQKVDEFIKKDATLGLLLIRFVPFLPYHFVNYALGFLKVNIWGFIWTTGLGILPFTIAMSGIYAGVRKGSLVWGAIGIVLFMLLLGLSWLLKRRKGMKMEVE
ncbi:TVP38/TMEM64 family protein [Paenibacillus alba]|uniref:TVP38/TMEM64 family membrane protein n=1 Tax=Paenibacillus alba TaxID=1197127 RepID=A0ABU6GFL5_9BACL|nr:VTT domain-containing protein [Paenibacillus alba]MEC0231987.1 VTT domain-containing protein [Paenibacillus alba]